MKPNGRPPKTERNNQIIADYKDGMSQHDLEKKYNLGYGYIQKIASQYKRNNQLKVEEKNQSQVTALYAERDQAIMKFLSRHGGRVMNISEAGKQESI